MSEAPQSKDLETAAVARDGTALRLRPIRPDDEALIQDLFAHMSREDRRLRFFISIGRLSHEFAARLCRNEFPRELALVALHQSDPLGIARYASGGDAAGDLRSAEYAIAVRSDWKGRGVGYVLMTHLIAAARDAGIGELVGDVIAENRPMIAMCREFGFRIERHPGDATLLRLRKPL